MIYFSLFMLLRLRRQHIK